MAARARSLRGISRISSRSLPGNESGYAAFNSISFSSAGSYLFLGNFQYGDDPDCGLPGLPPCQGGTSVPEPSSFLLSGLGLAAIGFVRRLRMKA